MPTVAYDARDAMGPRLQGWGRYARELLRALQAAGGLDYAVLGERGRGPELWWEQVTLPRTLRRRGADLVHVPNCFLPLRRPCPGVVSVLDLAFEAHPEDFTPRTRWKYRTITPRAVRSAERVIAISAFTRDDVVARYGIHEQKVRVVPLAAALPEGDAPAPAGPPYLLAVGDLRAKKNLRRLVRAFASLRAEGREHRLLLAGADAGEGAALHGDGVELLGYVDDARLDALLRGAAALVHPSLYEGFGLVVLEAMARGTPVVAADTTALPETAGGAAALCDPLDPADIARAIRTVLDDPERYAERGRARAAAFSWERTAAATRAVYEELL
ncbi:MAG TPA: glycosyltransferase family 1 protein [Solirubrobacteraceae bacterium]|nr:glycosyltransferase family 1 protein [Solirubrobacteraceae bacterium]